MRENFLYKIVIKYKISKGLFISYFIALATIIYFCFFTIFGDKGLIKLFALQKQIDNKEVSLQETENKMRNKKTMVEGMKAESLDIDLLDEQARKTLGYAGKNEVIIYQNKNDKESHESTK